MWRPVAADHLGGETVAVAVGETVAVWDAAVASYRVFERQGSALASGLLSALVADYAAATGSS